MKGTRAARRTAIVEAMIMAMWVELEWDGEADIGAVVVFVEEVLVGIAAEPGMKRFWTRGEDQVLG